MIPEIKLPSNPEITVKMRPTIVEDALNFSDIADGMEEALTTLFFETVQEKDTYSNPKKWTGDDRRFLLYWFWLNTTDDFKPLLTFSCIVCEEKHTSAVDLRLLADNYKPIKGKAERDIDYKETKIIVSPLNGEELEELEALNLDIEGSKPGSKECNLLEARFELLKFKNTISFEKEKDEKDPIDYREKTLLKMQTRDFKELKVKVDEALEDMEHGLSSTYHNGQLCLLTHKIPCTKERDKDDVEDKNKKEDGTHLRLPFRNIHYIPRI